MECKIRLLKSLIFVSIAFSIGCQNAAFATTPAKFKSCSELVSADSSGANIRNPDDFANRDWESYPYISLASLQPSEYSNNGDRNRGMFEGLLGGKRVVIKFVAHARGYNEYQWLKFLNHYGLGPKVFGFTKGWRVNGTRSQVLYAVVMEQIEGVNTKNFHSSAFLAQKSAIAEVERTGDLLSKHGVVANDLQFLITKTGRAILIDPEHFEIDPSRAAKETKEQVSGIVDHLRGHNSWLERTGATSIDH